MNRRLTSIIRFFMDELLPPIIRDNKYFMYPFFYLAFGGKNVKEAMNFKKEIYTYTPEDYEHFYQNLNSISRNRETDLNQNCINKIIELSKTENIKTAVDVGCGNGFMLKTFDKFNKSLKLSGVDLQEKVNGPFEYTKAPIEKLPYTDKQFDLVVCSHVIEHILKPEDAIKELIRITNKRLIIVVPKQRFYFYTLDEHVNFFQFEEQLTQLVGLDNFECSNINSDWFYTAKL